MPLFFSLAIHDALKEVDSQLEANETLFAYLDDVYVVTSPERTRPVYDLLGHQLQSVAGTQLHAGKTRVWNGAGQCPDEVEDLGEEVWNPRGIPILGTPVGCDPFVQEVVDKRLCDEAVHCGSPISSQLGQVLLHCAGPRPHPTSEPVH